jgi:inward rectifier potassium channel
LYVNVLVAIESLLGVLGFAVATGLVFSKFARPSARVLFSSVMVVTRRHGKPCLQLRCANARGNDLVEATAHVVVIKNDVTPEGHRMRRFHDLGLDRDRSPLFVLTWLVMHDLDEHSPLFGATPESLAEDDALFVVTIVGVDGTLGQTVHARHSYEYYDVRFGHRFVDVLTTAEDRRLTLDFTRFHDTEPDPEPPVDAAVSAGGSSSP